MRQLYDGVMVCNGHYSVPARPAIPGLEQFGGRVEHSHDYRGPEQYTGQAVVVLGAAASGTDISMELATAATTVYLSSYNPPLASVLPPNVQQVMYTQRYTGEPHVLAGQVAGVERCPGPGRLLLTDGREVEAAALLLATGYQYTFPFLDPECGVAVRGRRVAPLYKHLVNITHPTMCFIGNMTRLGEWLSLIWQFWSSLSSWRYCDLCWRQVSRSRSAPFPSSICRRATSLGC